MLQKNIIILFNLKNFFLLNQKLLIFQLYGPFSTLFASYRLGFPFFVKNNQILVLNQTKTFWNFINYLNLFFYSVQKFFFLEIFITGKGYKFERLFFENVKSFSLFLGMKSVFVVKPSLSCFLVGLNKKKVVLCSTQQDSLINVAKHVQSLKFPTKYFMQGVNLRFKVRKLQNFRHKKRK